LIASVSQPPVASLVTFRIAVLSAVEFDEQPLFAADEIDDIRSDRLLSNELISFEASRSLTLPESQLRFGRILTKSACPGRL
jgi:hypothetical protein